MDNRKRIDYRKEQSESFVPIYFSDKPYSPIRFIEERIVDIPGVKENYYTVNTLGQVFNCRGQEIHPHMINSGYMSYSLYTGHGTTSKEKYKHVLAHRLVKETFDPIPNAKEFTIDHNDGDKTNNALDNLEYVTQGENNERSQFVKPTHGSHNYQAKFNRSQLKIIVTELEKGTKYSEILNMIEVENTSNNQDYIGNIKRGKTYKQEIAEIRKELGFND